jgi:hypothetical protein
MTARDRSEEARVTREIASRAVRRLDLLEWVMLAGAMGLSLAGGALVALLLETSMGLSFRPMWVVASLLLFGVPGVIAIRRMRRDEREMRAKIQKLMKKNDG